MPFSTPPSILPYWSLCTESQTRQITIICCYKAFQESFDWSRKNLGLFMSPCIDLTLVRMNCRSIGLPPGRLNEHAQQHQGLLLSASCFIVLNRRRTMKRKGRRLRQRLSCYPWWFKGTFSPLFLTFAWRQQSVTVIFCPAMCVTNDLLSNLVLHKHTSLLTL